jgi:6-phosphogluconate dehydrogenase
MPSHKDIEGALYAAKIISYTQGFMLFRRAAAAYGWTLNYGAIAGMWMGGCIIRSVFLGDISSAFERRPDLECLLFDDIFRAALSRCDAALRAVVSAGVAAGIPMPGLGAALAFYDGYRTARLPANLLQAQRDYFGAHTFEYADAPGTWHHLNWTGTGGTTSSTHYDA